jgi:hypothetical protein
MKTQDVSKKGLKYGDEDEDAAERKELNAQNIAFGPLLNWLKRELKAQVSDGTPFSLFLPLPCPFLFLVLLLTSSQIPILGSCLSSTRSCGEC